MPIEDFEWEGDVREDGAALATPPARTGLLTRIRQSVWLEPALRLGGMAALLGVLAGIGVVATTYAKPGLPLPEGPRAVAAVLGTSWLKPTPAAVASPHAPAQSSAPALAPVPAPTGLAAAGSGVGPAEASPAPAAPGAAPAGITADGKVVLNAASADELTKLPGVGMKRALAIVSLRTKLKRFKSATELLRVKGIGPRGLQRMLPHLVLDAPVASS